MSLYPWEQAAGRPNPPQEDYPTFSRRTKIITPPAAEPVGTDELAGILKVSTGDEAALLTGLLIGARSWVEAWTGRAIITQTLQVWLDQFPYDRIVELPQAPAASITSFSWFDDQDNETSLDPAVDYFTDLINEPARLMLRQGIEIPQGLRQANGLQATFVAGYGADGTTVPQGLRQAILLLAAEIYLARGNQVDAKNFNRNDLASKDTLLLLQPYKIWR